MTHEENETLDQESAEEMSPRERAMHESVDVRAQVEAALFAAPKPLKPADLIEVVTHEISLKDMETLLHDLQEEFATRGGGFTLEYVRGLGYQFQSIPEVSPIMEKLFASRPRPLSRAALETLAIVAYRQPTTRATVEFIRGVDSGSIIKNLLERQLIRCVGRKEDAGRPMLFGTTDEFLHVFGIDSLQDLPPLQAFQPTSETMSEALKELEALEQSEVDVEEFVGDATEDLPKVSEGLIAEDDAAIMEGEADFNDSENETSQHGQEAASQINEAEQREKTQPASRESGDNEESKDQDTEMVVATGDRVSSGDRTLD